MRIGAFVNKFRPAHAKPARWQTADAAVKHLELVTIQGGMSPKPENEADVA
jgi:hypothetical protein